MSTHSKKTPFWQIALLIVGGVSFALLMVVGLLTLFPGLLNASQQRAEAGMTLDVEFSYLDGDMWSHQAGRIRPPEEDVTLAQYTLAWDANGFRVPQITAETYPIAAFGDSFTEGTTVARPWPDVLAAELTVPVRNYGYRGYGPKEIAQTAADYAADDPRDWVLYAHFSGNDLANANRSMREDLVERDPLARLEWLAIQAGNTVELSQNAPQTSPDGNYDYPMPVIIGGNFYELVFLEDLLWWQIAPETGFAGTRTLQVVSESLQTMANQVSDTTCHAFIFVPTKEQLYYPYIHEDVRQWLRNVGRRGVVTQAGTIALQDAPINEADEADFIERLDDQRDAMQQLATENGWLFIDLLEPFKQEVAAGRLLYYRYDGHWNQAGHDLAASVIADAMRNAEGCSLADIPDSDSTQSDDF